MAYIVSGVHTRLNESSYEIFHLANTKIKLQTCIHNQGPFGTSVLCIFQTYIMKVL